VEVRKPTVTTSKDEFGPTISVSRGVAKYPSNSDSERLSFKGTQVDISKTADGPQISTGSGSTTYTGANGLDSITKQKGVFVGLTPDGPAISKSAATIEGQNGQITSFELRDTTITPTADGGPDIIRTNLGRKMLHRDEAV
jgi:hypothetical protein